MFEEQIGGVRVVIFWKGLGLARSIRWGLGEAAFWERTKEKRTVKAQSGSAYSQGAGLPAA